MAPFKFTYSPNPKIADIYNALSPGSIPFSSMAGAGSKFVPATRTLPNSTDTYQSPVIAPPTKAVVTKTVVPSPPPPQAPVVATPPAVDYSKYKNPITGAIMSPQEYADFQARRVTGGSVPGYAGDSTMQGPQTREQLASTATDLNNQRNDIATGTTDPYKVGNQSGIAYSPAELAAIEKAYAGIYDPALKDVFAKLDKKDKEDAAALTLKNSLALEAQKHKNDLELKRTPTASESASAAALAAGGGTYVAGANPTVDAWAKRIFEGSTKITDIPASDKGMRNAVTVALQSYGNQPDGRPTTTEIGLQTLDAAKRLKEMFDKGQGTSVVGTSRIFNAGLDLPGSDAANFKNLFETLIANRSLEGVKFLKGQGQVSDAERLLLKNAMSELNLNQGEAEFKKSLQRIIDKLEGNAPSSTGNVLTAPDGVVVEITD